MTELSEKLTVAFKALRKTGYVARKSFWCCQSCAWSALDEDKAKKAVFYHRQDAADMRRGNGVHLAWAGDGKEIAGILKEAGIEFEWDGSTNKRFFCKPCEE